MGAKGAIAREPSQRENARGPQVEGTVGHWGTGGAET